MKLQSQILWVVVTSFCGNAWQGIILSLPKHSLDIVPIQIVCQRMTKTGQMEPKDCEGFDSVWEDVLHVVGCARNSSGKRKYQQNFLLLIQEVMRNHHHLFVDDEKLFIGNWYSVVCEVSVLRATT